MNASGFEPADTKVLIKPDPVEKKTAGGVILPDAAADKEKYASMRGVLVARGPNAFLEWGPSEADFTPGVRVVTAQYAGRRVKGDDGVEYIVMNDEDVLGRINTSQPKENHG
jgi:chaperonin GroES